MKYYIIAGEASGDLHGSNLMKCLKERDSSAVFRYWGGDLMYSQGGELVKHIESLAFMGFKEVLMNIRTIKRNFELCYADLLNFSPDVLILIDYPGFNLKVAEFAFKHEIKVFYYISPQIWAWKQSRIKKIKKFVNRMFVILPFEKDFYGRFDFPVDYVGHPLLDAIQEQLDISSDFNLFIRSNDLERKKIIALLPGSRKQEIQLKLPVMLSITEHFDDEYQFVIAA
ncbi:MAG: lipid-A-disaccharide synthase, partial [Bacteroidota bacterium]